MLPIFAKAPYCLVLFGYCCRRLSQHGVAEVQHCCRDAFFCVCSESFCHDLASHCSVLLWSLDGLFVLGVSPFAPQTPCSGVVYVARRNHPLKNHNTDESFLCIGGEFRLHDSSRFRKKLEMQNFGFTTILCQV